MDKKYDNKIYDNIQIISKIGQGMVGTVFLGKLNNKKYIVRFQKLFQNL
jgi:hypothetical protein